uniref:Candidate secreted effector n=1 Tax=Meloidogyne incognita TaxID=6306 RepID=A0A914MNY8_MELIC
MTTSRSSYYNARWLSKNNPAFAIRRAWWVTSYSGGCCGRWGSCCGRWGSCCGLYRNTCFLPIDNLAYTAIRTYFITWSSSGCCGSSCC